MNDLDMAVSRLTDALAASDELGMPQVACERDTARVILEALAASPQQSPISGEGGEPVAWRYVSVSGGWRYTGNHALAGANVELGVEQEPLYTAPPVPSVLVGEGHGSSLRDTHRVVETAIVEHMVQRFLAWRLPENFNPDNGISFKPTFNDHMDPPMRCNPVGTNLFDQTQAEAMVRHMLEGLPT